jgi:hypothetical protein
MSARAASSALILSILIAPGFFRPAQAGPWLPAPGEYYTELRGGLFSADTYRNDAGERVSLGGKWEERSLLSTVELGWKKRFSIFMSAPFTSVTLIRPDLPAFSATNTGLSDLTLGMRYALKQQGATALAAELRWSAPLGYSQGTSEPRDAISLARDSAAWAPYDLARRNSRLGDGRQTLAGSLLYGRPLGHRGFLQFAGGGAYRYVSLTNSPNLVVQRFALDTDGQVTPYLTLDPWRSSSLGWTMSADAGFWLTRSLFLGGRYSGRMVAFVRGKYDSLGHAPVTTATKDLIAAIESGAEANELSRSIHLAGPVIVWRVDERLDLSAGSWSTAVGKNTLHYDQVYVALTFKQTGLNRLQGFLGGTKAP